MSGFKDVVLVCVERRCGMEFTWSVRDQEFYARQGYDPPKRCPECRQRRKAERGRQGNPGAGRRRRGDREAA